MFQESPFSQLSTGDICFLKRSQIVVKVGDPYGINTSQLWISAFSSMKKQPFEKRPCVRAVCAEDRLVINSSDVNLLLQHQKEIERNEGPRKVSPRSITDIPIETASSFYKVKDVSEWQCWASCVVSLLSNLPFPSPLVELIAEYTVSSYVRDNAVFACREKRIWMKTQTLVFEPMFEPMFEYGLWVRIGMTTQKKLVAYLTSTPIRWLRHLQKKDILKWNMYEEFLVSNHTIFFNVDTFQ